MVIFWILNIYKRGYKTFWLRVTMILRQVAALAFIFVANNGVGHSMIQVRVDLRHATFEWGLRWIGQNRLN